MNVGNALKVTCVGFAGGVLLRVVQMLFFFDYETGFYTDNGLMAWISVAFVAAACIMAFVMCFRSRRYFGSYSPRKNIVTGVVSAVSGIILIAGAVMLYAEFFLDAPDADTYVAMEMNVIFLVFIICSVLFGIVQFTVSIGFFKGVNVISKVPLIYLFSVLWGLVYLVLVYVFYARSVLVVENIFTVIGAGAMLLSLFYLCRIFAGVEDQGAAKRLFVSGMCSVMLTVTYSASNLVMLLLGKNYSGEVPVTVQIMTLGIATFILVFLMTFKKYNLRRIPAAAQGEHSAPKKGAPSGGRRFRAE